MQQKPYRMAEFAGINNVLPPEEVRPNEFQIMKNAYVNDAGKVRRRKGYQKVYDGSVHSLYSTGETLLFREETDLKRLEPDFSATTLRTGLQGNRFMRYLTIADRTFFSDGIITGVYQNGFCRSWGLEVPASPLLLGVNGLLPAGKYQVALTFLRNDMQESGARLPVMIELGADSGIMIGQISMSLDPTIVGINVYLSPPNGEMLFRVASISNGDESIIYSGDGKGSFPLLTALMQAPPAGQFLTYYNGRIYIAAGNILWYTEKDYAVELISLRKSFIPFASRITLLAAVKSGIWISTLSEIGFISGDPSGTETRYQKKAGYGAIEGTAAYMDRPLNVGDTILQPGWHWVTPYGICYGGEDGQFINRTEGRVVFPAVLSGVGAVKIEEDANLYILGLYLSNVGLASLPELEVNGAGQEA